MEADNETRKTTKQEFDAMAREIAQLAIPVVQTKREVNELAQSYMKMPSPEQFIQLKKAAQAYLEAESLLLRKEYDFLSKLPDDDPLRDEMASYLDSKRVKLSTIDADTIAQRMTGSGEGVRLSDAMSMAVSAFDQAAELEEEAAMAAAQTTGKECGGKPSPGRNKGWKP